MKCVALTTTNDTKGNQIVKATPIKIITTTITRETIIFASLCPLHVVISNNILALIVYMQVIHYVVHPLHHLISFASALLVLSLSL